MITQACGIETELAAELKKQFRQGLDSLARRTTSGRRTLAAKADSSLGRSAAAKIAASASSAR
ncbi:Hypothetical protein AT6N2_L0830 [Agrobacterium tumefaciens]|nr:Hypothetical protein AT6N2_L0830 [Agrobacterium tumefaciens]